MVKKRFVFEMMNGKQYRVYAMSLEEARVLTHAYCILKAVLFSPDVVWVDSGSSFEKMWAIAETVILQAA